MRCSFKCFSLQRVVGYTGGSRCKVEGPLRFFFPTRVGRGGSHFGLLLSPCFPCSAPGFFGPPSAFPYNFQGAEWSARERRYVASPPGPCVEELCRQGRGASQGRADEERCMAQGPTIFAAVSPSPRDVNREASFPHTPPFNCTLLQIK